MADLNNLLGELEEERPQEFNALGGDDDDDYEKDAAPGRPSVETAATELMTGDDWDSPSAPRRHIAVPAALQEAKRRRDEDYGGDYGNNEEEPMGDAGNFDLLTGETATQDEGQIMNELYTKLHHFWHQEKHCPELLEYDHEMVEQVKEQIEARQEWIDQMLEDNTQAAGLNAGEASVQHLLATLAQVDLDRVKYVFANWLAQRLSKIEAHPLHMRERVDHMSDAELAYLKEYGSLLEDHLRQTVLDHIPEAWQGLDEAHMVDQPDYEGYHFWLVNEPIEADEVEQDEGSCLVAKFSAMRDFMREGKVELQL
jgi:GINS complex subunit 4